MSPPVQDNPGDIRLIREMLTEAMAARLDLVHADLSLGLQNKKAFIINSGAAPY